MPAIGSPAPATGLLQKTVVVAGFCSSLDRGVAVVELVGFEPPVGTSLRQERQKYGDEDQDQCGSEQHASDDHSRQGRRVRDRFQPERWADPTL